MQRHFVLSTKSSEKVVDNNDYDTNVSDRTWVGLKLISVRMYCYHVLAMVISCQVSRQLSNLVLVRWPLLLQQSAETTIHFHARRSIVFTNVTRQMKEMMTPAHAHTVWGESLDRDTGAHEAATFRGTVCRKVPSAVKPGNSIRVWKAFNIFTRWPL